MKSIKITHSMPVNRLAELLELDQNTLIKHLLLKKNLLRTTHQIVDLETAREMALDLGFRLDENI